MRQVAGLASYACLAAGHFTRHGDGDQAAAQNDTRTYLKIARRSRSAINVE